MIISDKQSNCFIGFKHTATIKSLAPKNFINIIPGKNIFIADIFSRRKVYFCFEMRNFEGFLDRM